MTALQSIIKEAKAIRRKSPKMEWKKAVAQASAIYASKHKGKSPVGKKKAVKKAAKKKAVGSVKKKAAKKVARKRVGVVKKATTMHKDTKSHNVNIRVMSGVDNSIFDQLQKIKKSEIFYNDIKKNLEKEYSYLRTQKGSQINSQKISNRKYYKKVKDILKELKEHTRQLKKHI